MPPGGTRLTLDDEGRLIRVAAGRVTREIGVKELKDRASDVIDRVANGERAAITRRNELVAVLLSVDEALEFVLAHAEEFVLARAGREMGSAEAVARNAYDVGYCVAAASRTGGAFANNARIRHEVRRLAIRAALRVPSMRARTARGALAEPGLVADGVAIDWIRHTGGGFFVLRAGFALIACDVLPDEGAVLVFAIAGRGELAGRLGIQIHRPRAVPVGPLGWRP